MNNDGSYNISNKTHNLRNHVYRNLDQRIRAGRDFTEGISACDPSSRLAGDPSAGGDPMRESVPFRFFLHLPLYEPTDLGGSRAACVRSTRPQSLLMARRMTPEFAACSAASSHSSVKSAERSSM
ncbi:hypothetical protein AVEN_238715-1 [Araneus ventricosus]|uniref:Uncharacterized protein n=1 Tax=Araneus ventricosus TaxID=182803 RepID=A0A4Y2BX61_ARAVE|nr:hypothetical protein AVEN_238715-1 [Araneus ventricosus]